MRCRFVAQWDHFEVTKVNSVQVVLAVYFGIGEEYMVVNYALRFNGAFSPLVRSVSYQEKAMRYQPSMPVTR